MRMRSLVHAWLRVPHLVLRGEQMALAGVRLRVVRDIAIADKFTFVLCQAEIGT